MKKHSIVNLKCPCFLFRYPNLDIPSQALFNLHRASALPLRYGSKDDQTFQSPPGQSRRPVIRRRYCMVPVWHSDMYYIIMIQLIQLNFYTIRGCNHKQCHDLRGRGVLKKKNIAHLGFLSFLCANFDFVKIEHCTLQGGI